MPSSQEIIITLIGGTFLLLFLVVVVIVAATRYQNRKRIHLMDVQRLKYEGEQQLLKTRLEVHEKTLTDVSHEIHDNIGQMLSVVKLNLHSIKSTDEKMNGQVKTAISLVSNALSDLRNLSKVLNSNFIAHQSISYLLQREIEVISKADAFALEFKCEGDELEILPEKKLVLFRITQECLQNAIKHSKATHIYLHLSFTPLHCRLTITDNGVGFNYETAKNGNGMTNLRTRSALIQASFEVETKENSGTKVKITMPLV